MDEIIIKFNDIALEFLNKMELSFPNENRISKYKMFFNTVKSISFRKPVEIFMENLEPFGKEIMTKCEIFIKDVNNISGTIGLVDYWDDLEPTKQKTIWEYLQLLYVLGMQALNKQEALTKIMNLV